MALPSTRIAPLRGNSSESVEHVYEEYNSDADGTANEAIDLSLQVGGIPAVAEIINENWNLRGLEAAHRSLLG